MQAKGKSRNSRSLQPPWDSAGHPLCTQAHHHLVCTLVGERLAEEIALDGVAPKIAHPLEILGGLNALGGHRHAEALGELDDRLDDCDVLGPRACFADEAAVDLQFVEHG